MTVVSLCFAVLLFWAEECSAHGRMRVPPGRSTMWRYGFGTTPNYNDMELNCGGFATQWNTNGGLCGICGDSYSDQEPRANEANGIYGNGIIVRSYTQGQTIQVDIELTSNHKGWMEFRICPNNNVAVTATQACLDQYVLQRADGGGTKTNVPGDTNFFNIDMVLPAGLTCSQCVFQWKYHTGNSWGCDDPNTCGIGLGPQEEFYACADVKISGDGVPPSPTTTTSTTTTTGTSTPSSGTTTTSTTTTGTSTPSSGTTTTSRTTTTTSTTTTTTTTSAPSGTCQAAGAYVNVTGMDNWCNLNCPTNCPASHCNDACRQ